MADVNDTNELIALAPIHAAVGLTCDVIEEGHAVADIPDGEFVRSAHAALHGGIIALLADVTSGMALEGKFELGVSIPVSTDLNVRFYGQPQSWPVTAEAHIVHAGSRILSTECIVRDAGGRQIARTTATYMVLTSFGDQQQYKRD